MTMDITFTVALRVDDVQALHAAAFNHGTRVDGLDDDETLELIGPKAEPDAQACLVMLLDPGSLPGCTIESSVAEVRDNLAD